MSRVDGAGGVRRDAVATALTSLAAKEPDLRRSTAHRGRWARSFATAAYRLALARLPDENGLNHHADLLEADPSDRSKVLGTLQAAPGAFPLAPAPEVPDPTAPADLHIGRSTPREVLRLLHEALRMLHQLKARVHDLDQKGRRRDVYLAEVLASVESLRVSLVEQLDAALHRSALQRGQHTADRAIAHLTSARSFCSGGPDGVTVVDLSRLLVAVPGDDWALGARLALRGDPQTGLTEHVAAVLAVPHSAPLRLTDRGSARLQGSDASGRDRAAAVLVDLGAGADAGLAALLAARAGHRVHVVEPDDRRRGLIAHSFALNDLPAAGVHADVSEVAEPIAAVRLHDDSDLAACLQALPGTIEDLRVWCPAQVRPAVPGWTARGVAGLPGAWELARA